MDGSEGGGDRPIRGFLVGVTTEEVKIIVLADEFKALYKLSRQEATALGTAIICAALKIKGD